MGTIKGPWPEESHSDKHKRLLDVFKELMEDCNDGLIEVPRDLQGNIMWNAMSVAFLLQWATINAKKITHKHDPKG